MILVIFIGTRWHSCLRQVKSNHNGIKITRFTHGTAPPPPPPPPTHTHTHTHAHTLPSKAHTMLVPKFEKHPLFADFGRKNQTQDIFLRSAYFLLLPVYDKSSHTCVHNKWTNEIPNGKKIHAKFYLFQNFVDSCLKNYPFFSIWRIRASHLKMSPFSWKWLRAWYRLGGAAMTRNHTLNSHKTPHTLPSTVMVQSVWYGYVEKIDLDILGLYCTAYTQHSSGSLHTRPVSWTDSPAWISNNIYLKAWDEIIYPSPNLNGATVEVWELISKFIPYVPGHVITYSC